MLLNSPVQTGLAEAAAESQDEKANFLSLSLRKRFLGKRLSDNGDRRRGCWEASLRPPERSRLLDEAPLSQRL